MPDYVLDVGTAIDNRITGHIATLGGINLGDGKWLLNGIQSACRLRGLQSEGRVLHLWAAETF